ncbi:hypothetical protein [Phocaeicola dorei]|uniref:hypothetical protein n=1 Tax=Phocaeicola dorei TaxID=357276 RepID=UPI002E787F60|nr:hypothetical protein [Phocaeicola dorei]
MDQTLLKYWKTCLQDAERKAIAPKGARITLNIGDKILLSSTYKCNFLGADNKQ